MATHVQPCSKRCSTSFALDSRFSTSTTSTSWRVGWLPINTVGRSAVSSSSTHASPAATALTRTPSMRPSRKMWRTVWPGSPLSRTSISPWSAAVHGTGDGMGHRHAVRVDAEIKGGDHQSDHRRAAGGKVAGGTVRAIPERVRGEPGDPLTDLGSHTVAVVEGTPMQWPATPRRGARRRRASPLHQRRFPQPQPRNVNPLSPVQLPPGKICRFLECGSASSLDSHGEKCQSVR